MGDLLNEGIPMFFSYFNTDCLVVSTVWGVLNNYRVGYIHHFFQQNAGFFSHPFEKKNARKGQKFYHFGSTNRGENTYIDETYEGDQIFFLRVWGWNPVGVTFVGGFPVCFVKTHIFIWPNYNISPTWIYLK